MDLDAETGAGVSGISTCGIRSSRAAFGSNSSCKSWEVETRIAHRDRP